MGSQGARVPSPSVMYVHEHDEHEEFPLSDARSEQVIRDLRRRLPVEEDTRVVSSW
jgi:hypothetical protein